MCKRTKRYIMQMRVLSFKAFPLYLFMVTRAVTGITICVTTNIIIYKKT